MNKIISPIAIDLGARNTGVYFAHYEAGSSPEDEIGREGKVYQLEKDKYTLLMVDRTAARHQRRGYDRRQMAKRLFKLIWCKHFGLPWDKDVQQAVSFLLNRRGDSYLTAECDPDGILRKFPNDAYDVLPILLQQATVTDDGSYDFANALTEWANEGANSVKEKIDLVNAILYSEKLRQACLQFQDSGKYVEKGGGKNKLSSVARDVFNSLEKRVQCLAPARSESYTYQTEDGEKTLPYVYGDYVNLEAYINHSGSAAQILESLPDKIGCGSDADNRKIIKHLGILVSALSEIYNEFESGKRHRSEYFKEIKNVLEKTNHRSGYLKRFCGKVQSDGFQGLTVNSLSNLIGHISNLELKPLRKYFNDKKHAVSKTNKDGDYWDMKRITRFFDLWIMKEWRVDPEKDKLKAKGNISDYQELKKQWQEWQGRSDTIIDFWLNTDPNYTVPPYQDNNNRRPPKCQSLLLNVGFLDRKYPGWQRWLGKLKGLPGIEGYLEGYTKELAELESGKGKRYFTKEKTGKLLIDSGRRGMAELDARILQFIFDRVKSEDDLKLNEIYSHAKKVKQDTRDGESTKDASEKLQGALSESRIPKVLKGEVVDGVFPEESFLHLVCKYYKFRQRARDGRIYIHPEYRDVKGRGYENTGRFNDKEDLLIYCNHKPRQKRYQMIWDLAGLLQVPPQKLEGVAEEHSGETIGDKLVDWLSKIKGKGLQTNCERAAREQKNRRGRLKMDIQNVFGFTESKVADAKSLHSYCIRAGEFCTAVTESLYSDADQAKWAEELKKNPATAVYLLAQINNIAFKERSGNANTCAVCSMDNSHRMQMVAARDDGTTAKASRLPAIPTRIIDGAVMRMARIVGGAIAEDKWTKIEAELEAGKKVCVPIITESNRFQFEPDLKALKGKKIDNRDKVFQESNPLDDKDKRIKLASQDVCPYTGNSVQGGDKDHIIPRSSEWGVLNDEANLIWASDKGNKEIKQDKEFSLKDLNDKYKQAVFEKTDDDQIENWITKEIDNGSSEGFKFGRYHSFINLTTDQQKAFRHALFLPKEHPLRDKVINAIDNKNRTLVNGTQRYFAEVLANNLHKLAKRKGKEKLLSFDYFGVEAWDTRRGDGVKDLRSLYETVDSVIASYAKSEDKKQQAYSHLLDAQLAFVIVADAHRNQGGLRLQIGDDVKKEPRYDRETGELSGLLYTILVPDDDFRLEPSLGRRKAYDVETHHRELLNKGQKSAVHISYKIHRDNLIAERFMPLIQLENGEFKKGFSIKNSIDYKRDDFEKIKEFLYPSKNNENVWLVRKKEALSYLMDSGRNGLNKEEQKIAKLLDGLIYQTLKKKIDSVLTPPSTRQEHRTVSDALQNWDSCINEMKFKKDGVVLPIFYEWEKLRSELEKADPSQPLQVFLQSSKIFRDKQNGSIKNHNKKRKVYSLPIIVGIGSIRLKRRTWNGQSAIQTVATEGLAKYGLDSKQRPHTALSKNSIPIKHYFGIPQELHPEPREWKQIPDKDIIKYNEDGDIEILSGEVKHQDAGRCRVKLRVRDIQSLSLSQDKNNWKGKLFRYDKIKNWQEKTTNEKGENHHYLSSEWRWFSKPFELPRDRNEVIIKNVDGVYEIEFTIRKVAEIKTLLLL